MAIFHILIFGYCNGYWAIEFSALRVLELRVMWLWPSAGPPTYDKEHVRAASARWAEGSVGLSISIHRVNLRDHWQRNHKSHWYPIDIPLISHYAICSSCVSFTTHPDNPGLLPSRSSDEWVRDPGTTLETRFVAEFEPWKMPVLMGDCMRMGKKWSPMRPQIDMLIGISKFDLPHEGYQPVQWDEAWRFPKNNGLFSPNSSSHWTNFWDF